jgi:hypothetical protein
VDRADLADEVRTELPDHAVGLHELPPEQLGRPSVVGRVLVVVGKRDRRFDLVRCRPDGCRDAQLVQRGHQLGIEDGDRLGVERHRADPAVTVPNMDLVVDEVELDVEAAGTVRNRGGGQPTWADVQRHLPPMVQQRGMGEPDLAHDLGPHVQCVAGLDPVLDSQAGPF